MPGWLIVVLGLLGSGVVFTVWMCWWTGHSGNDHDAE